MTFNIILTILIFQRLIESSLSQKNLSCIQHLLITPINYQEKKTMLLLHGAWFSSCFIEFYFLGKTLSFQYLILAITILLLCQYVRYLSITTLGPSWTQLPIAYQGQMIKKTGPYRLMKHPNYFIVMIEIILVPLIGQCFWTASIFSFLNLIFLTQRIQLEEKALNQLKYFNHHPQSHTGAHNSEEIFLKNKL